MSRVEESPKTVVDHFFPPTSVNYARATLMVTPQNWIFLCFEVKNRVWCWNLMLFSKNKLNAINSSTTYKAETWMSVYGAPKTTFILLSPTHKITIF